MRQITHRRLSCFGDNEALASGTFANDDQFTVLLATALFNIGCTACAISLKPGKRVRPARRDSSRSVWMRRLREVYREVPEFGHLGGSDRTVVTLT
jgi:hypothetical protein